MHRKTYLKFCILPAIVLLVASALFVSSASAARILIGIGEDTTGYNADAGRAETDAGILCIEEWNKRGGINGQKIEYVMRNNGGDPIKAATIAKEFVNLGVTGVLAGTTTTVGLAENSVLTPAQIPYMMCSMSNKFWDTRGPDGKWYAFASGGSEAVLAEAWIETAIKYVHPHKRVAILYVNILWGKSLKDTITDLINTKYAAEKMDVVGAVGMDLKATDASKTLMRIKELKPDVLLTIIFAQGYQAYYRACNDFNYYPASVAYWGLAETVYLSGERRFLYNTYGYAGFDGIKKAAVDKLAKFKRRFGYTPVAHWTEAYDGMNVLLTAIKHAGTDRIAIRDWIATKARGLPLIEGNEKAVARIPDGPPYFYALILPKDFAVVYVDKNGKLVWKL